MFNCEQAIGMLSSCCFRDCLEMAAHGGRRTYPSAADLLRGTKATALRSWSVSVNDDDFSTAMLGAGGMHAGRFAPFRDSPSCVRID